MAHRRTKIVMVASSKDPASGVHPGRQHRQLGVARRHRARRRDVGIGPAQVVRLEAEAPHLIVVIDHMRATGQRAVEAKPEVFRVRAGRHGHDAERLIGTKAHVDVKVHAADAGVAEQADHPLDPEGTRSWRQADLGVDHEEDAYVMMQKLADVIGERGTRQVGHMMQIGCVAHNVLPERVASK